MAIVKKIPITEISFPTGMIDASIVAHRISGLGLLDIPLTEIGICALLYSMPIVVERNQSKSDGFDLRFGAVSFLLAKRYLSGGAIVPVLDLSEHQGWDAFPDVELIACLGVVMAAFSRSEAQILHASTTSLSAKQRKKLMGVSTSEELFKALQISQKRREKIPAKDSQLSLIREMGFDD